MTSLKIDLSKREDVMMKHSTMPVLHFYDTFPNAFSMPALALEEIMAEKIRAIIYTRHPRHLYDIQYMHRRGVRINPGIVRAKIRYAYDEDFDLEKLKERLPEKARYWTNDMTRLVPGQFPLFDDVVEEVLRVISDAMA